MTPEQEHQLKEEIAGMEGEKQKEEEKATPSQQPPQRRRLRSKGPDPAWVPRPASKESKLTPEHTTKEDGDGTHAAGHAEPGRE